VILLVERCGNNPNNPINPNNTRRYGQSEVVELLVANMTSETLSGLMSVYGSPLHLATRMGHTKTVAILLRKGTYNAYNVYIDYCRY